MKASAVCTLPNGQSLAVPKEGGTFAIDPPIDLSIDDPRVVFDSRLYIYDRQPETGYYFTVSSCAQPNEEGVAKVRFYQGGPAICFNLLPFTE